MMKTHHTVRAFADELHTLHTKVGSMHEQVQAQLHAAMQLLLSPDEAQAKTVIQGDAQVNRTECEIEDMVVRIIALRQPMGLDLRQIITAMKVASDLERVGDLAKGIAKRILAMKVSKEVLPSSMDALFHALYDMAKAAQLQLEEVLVAYESGSDEKALSVWEKDNAIDRLYDAIFRQLVTYMMEDPRLIGMGAHCLFIAKNLERVGDHVTNIAEMIHYLRTGDWTYPWKSKG